MNNTRASLLTTVAIALISAVTLRPARPPSPPKPKDVAPKYVSRVSCPNGHIEWLRHREPLIWNREDGKRLFVYETANDYPKFIGSAECRVVADAPPLPPDLDHGRITP